MSPKLSLRTLAPLLVALLVLFSPNVARAADVAKPTQDEIIDYYKCHDYNVDRAATFAEEPSLTQPHAAGRLDDETLRQAMNYLSLVRYVAGVPDSVKLDESFTEAAQAGALVTALNGYLDHEPDKPEGLSQSLYQLGYEGTSHGNLSGSGYGTFNPVQSMEMYLSDNDASNISRVGHRRWVLDPTLTRTGFGQVQNGRMSWGCMYVVDTWRNPSVTGVAWPAHNMPVELFGEGDPWSYSMPASWFGDNPTVKLTRVSDERVWNFSKSGSDGKFYVSATNSYGRLGCIIFQPEELSVCAPGETYHVEIKAAGGSVSYTVNFFSMTGKPTVGLWNAEAKLAQTSFTYDGKAKYPDVTVTLNGRTLVRGTDYEVAYHNNVNAADVDEWNVPYARVFGLGHYTGEVQLEFSIARRSIAGASVGKIADQTYTGGQLRPVPTVTVDGKALVSGRDFTCSYSNNVLAGTAKITITGLDNYTGTTSTTFTIKPEPKPEPAKTQAMHRLYNQWTGEHFYTASAAERDSLVSVGWTSEGVGWVAPTSGQKVYRLYNPFVAGGDHHYTMDVEEYNTLATLGWEQEGVGWFSGGTVKVYRQYNPYATTGTHNYTTDKNENDTLVSLGWEDEGVGWYAVSKK